MLGPQLQLLLDGIDHAAPPGVDAEVLKGQLEVGDVWPHVLQAQELRGGGGGGRLGEVRQEGMFCHALPCFRTPLALPWHPPGRHRSHRGSCRARRVCGSPCTTARCATIAPCAPTPTLRATRLAKKSSCSEMGSTSGPSVVMLALRAWPAMRIRSLLRNTPAGAGGGGGAR